MLSTLHLFVCRPIRPFLKFARSACNRGAVGEGPKSYHSEQRMEDMLLHKQTMAKMNHIWREQPSYQETVTAQNVIQGTFVVFSKLKKVPAPSARRKNNVFWTGCGLEQTPPDCWHFGAVVRIGGISRHLPVFLFNNGGGVHAK